MLGLFPWEEWLPPYVFGPLISIGSICIFVFARPLSWWQLQGIGFCVIYGASRRADAGSDPGGRSGRSRTRRDIGDAVWMTHHEREQSSDQGICGSFINFWECCVLICRGTDSVLQTRSQTRHPV